MIRTHAELERYHYQSLSNPLYVLEGLIDVRAEELALNIPNSTESGLEERIALLETQYQYIDPFELQKPSKLYDKCQQLQARQNYLQLQVDDIKQKPARQSKGKRIKYE